eukprot:CAMPEP_0119216534 /NCGR_PEP_ID=MMETSP1327-20130426/15518_1 /TAXON_ID=38833 /ORGANISM="Micromonas pusilla, Strain RCC2306" /LENGTH=232 /DNA_ID=CAMNT_0007214453 /DNA_START=252 /DNA_END=947 /DNA_ORIENTATION=-
MVCLKPSVCSRSLAPTPHFTSKRFADSRTKLSTFEISEFGVVFCRESLLFSSRLVCLSLVSRLVSFSLLVSLLVSPDAPASVALEDVEDRESARAESPASDFVSSLPPTDSRTCAFSESLSSTYLCSKSDRSKYDDVSIPAFCNARFMSPTETRSFLDAAVTTRFAPRREQSGKRADEIETDFVTGHRYTGTRAARGDRETQKESVPRTVPRAATLVTLAIVVIARGSVTRV